MHSFSSSARSGSGGNVVADIWIERSNGEEVRICSAGSTTGEFTPGPCTMVYELGETLHIHGSIQMDVMITFHSIFVAEHVICYPLLNWQISSTNWQIQLILINLNTMEDKEQKIFLFKKILIPISYVKHRNEDKFNSNIYTFRCGRQSFLENNSWIKN